MIAAYWPTQSRRSRLLAPWTNRASLGRCCRVAPPCVELLLVAMDGGGGVGVAAAGVDGDVVGELLLVLAALVAESMPQQQAPVGAATPGRPVEWRELPSTRTRDPRRRPPSSTRGRHHDCARASATWRSRMACHGPRATRAVAATATRLVARSDRSQTTAPRSAGSGALVEHSPHTHP